MSTIFAASNLTKTEAAVQSISEILQEERSKFRGKSSQVITEFLEGLSHEEQLHAVKDTEEGLCVSMAMQALAYSEYEDVQQAVLNWVESDEVFDPFVTAILCESDFENIAEGAWSEFNLCFLNPWGMCEYFQSFA